jgi:hypothetical protein
MCRSSSPLFGERIFHQFSHDEFKRGFRQSFRQEGIDSGVIMSADAECWLVRDGQDRGGTRTDQPPDGLPREPCSLRVSRGVN